MARIYVWVAVLAGCSSAPAKPQAPAAGGSCDRGAIEHVVAPLKAKLQAQLDQGQFPKPGGDRDLRARIADLDQRAAGCARGDGDDCANLAVLGDSRGLFACEVHAWEAGCAAATARACLLLGDIYSTTYYMPSLRSFPADPAKAAELYARGTGLYQQACDQGDEAVCRRMAYEPTVMAKEPKRALAILVGYCDRGDGTACMEAGSGLTTDAADRPKLWERGCFATKPSGLACKILADLPENEARKAELDKRACDLDARTCPRPPASPPP